MKTVKPGMLTTGLWAAAVLLGLAVMQSPAVGTAATETAEGNFTAMEDPEAKMLPFKAYEEVKEIVTYVTNIMRKSEVFLQSGALIAKNIVVASVSDLLPEEMIVRVATLQANQENTSSHKDDDQVRHVIDVIRHPKHQSGKNNVGKAFDIEILVLDKPVESYKPIKLDPPSCSNMSVYGWYRNLESKQLMPTLLTARMENFETNNCAKLLKHKIPEGTMCAIIANQVNKNCAWGEGALLVSACSSPAEESLLGLASYKAGDSCNEVKPYIYTDINAVRDWINEEVKRFNKPDLQKGEKETDPASNKEEL